MFLFNYILKTTEYTTLSYSDICATLTASLIRRPYAILST